MNTRIKSKLYLIKNTLQNYTHVWVFSFFIVYMFYYNKLENNIPMHYHIIHSRMDDLIPFNEYFIIPYFIWFLYVFFTILFFFFKDKEEFYRYMLLTYIGMGLYIIICNLFPNGTDLRPVIDADKNFFTKCVAFLHSIDTNTNTFPSIHVYNSLSTHIAITNSKYLYNKPFVKTASLLLCISICLSTLFLKQHSVIDLIASSILIYVTYLLIYAKLDKKENIAVKQKIHSNSFHRY